MRSMNMKNEQDARVVKFARDIVDIGLKRELDKSGTLEEQLLKLDAAAELQRMIEDNVI